MKLSEMYKGRIMLKIGGHNIGLTLEEWKVLVALSESAVSLLENAIKEGE